MKRVKMQSKFKDGTVCTIMGIVTNNIYDYNHNIIGYEVKYDKDKYKNCLFKYYKIQEEHEFNLL